VSLLGRLKELGLLKGRGEQRTLLALCHAGRLVGGLSISLRATPDEVVGPLSHAMGGVAMKLKVLDVRGTRPMELQVEFPSTNGPRVERWELDDVRGLVHNLNDLYRDEPTVKQVRVLGEWEDMLQLWCLSAVDAEQVRRL
jgi:hypothetical protein